MTTARLQAQPRATQGGREADKLRKTGRVPAMLYGAGEPNLPLSLDLRDFQRSLKSTSIEFTLEIDGKPVQAALRDVQFDRLGDAMQHVDFQRDPTGEVGKKLVEAARAAETLRRKMVEAAIEHQAFEEARRKAAEAAAAAAAAAASPGSAGGAAATAGAAAAPAAGAAPAKEAAGKDKK